MADDLGYEPPVGRPRSGAVTAVAIVNYVLGALYFICGLIFMVAFNAIAGVAFGQIQEAATKGDAQAQEAMKNAGGAAGILAGMGIFVGVCIIIFGIPMLLAGYGVMKRAQWGRILTLILGGFAGVFALLSLFNRSWGGVVIYAAYAVLVFVVLLNKQNAAEFR